MKKILSVLLAFALMAALAACGKKDEPPTTSTPADSSDAPAASSTPTPPDDEPLLPIDPYADVPEDPKFFYWYDDKDNIIVEQYTGSNSIVRIPAEFEGLPVTEIGNDGTAGVFVGSETIEVVIIPEGVVKINSRAFKGLPNLKTVILPSTLKYMYTYVFDDCPNLTDIVLPDNLISMAEGVFNDCDSLTRMAIPDSVTHDFRKAFNGVPVGFELVFRGVTYIGEAHEDLGIFYPGLAEAMIEAGIEQMPDKAQYS
ncbi:leucine-rich repeat domain-containing protein [Ruminococcaceae bacterium OttesenSCG-928-D13]|nr:leucine-rich repeat domain-containing protein [Ruminococcaceae bacterium OttesenSCG-928-D13]